MTITLNFYMFNALFLVFPLLACLILTKILWSWYYAYHEEPKEWLVRIYIVLGRNNGWKKEK